MILRDTNIRPGWPIPSQKLQDVFGYAHQDLTTIIGYTDASGTLLSSGVYDTMDDDLERIQNSLFNTYELDFGTLIGTEEELESM
jgi:hypothetical protein